MSTKTKEQISFNMKQVKNKDSDIELMLRKELWNRGLRYRKNVNKIIGKPDIVFKSKKVAVFVTVSFGMDMIGRTEREILNLIKIFGYLKLKEILKETKK